MGHNHPPVKDGDHVFTDMYVCPAEACDNTVNVADYAHRTNAGYTSSTVRCPDHDEPMKRVD